KWYGAALLRYGRHEFDAEPVHAHHGWPIGYDELAPYYDEAEALLDVRTFETEPALTQIVHALARTNPSWRTAPLPLGLAANIREHRMEAMRFDGFASVAHLKSDAETRLLSRMQTLPNVTIISGHAVESLLPSDAD